MKTKTTVSAEDFERGLQFAHVMVSVIQDQSSEAIAYVQALADVLVQKGLLSADELEAPLEQARKELAGVMMPHVRLAELGDKYTAAQTAVIDCASLIPLCGGRCCTFKFFLTRQDLDEGVARWDYGNPYWIRQQENGFCVHLDPETRVCAIHPARPHVCRQYDCRQDQRVWLDFERRIPAPMADVSGDAPVAMAEVAFQDAMKTGNKDKDASQEMVELEEK